MISDARPKLRTEGEIGGYQFGNMVDVNAIGAGGAVNWCGLIAQVDYVSASTRRSEPGASVLRKRRQ